jgi:hypothetical protein
MVQYRLVVSGTIYNIRTVGNQTWGGEQGLVVYETPGSDGGVVINTGRLTREITMTGRLLKYPTETLEETKDRFEQLRENGKVVTLLAPVQNNDTGRYHIKSFFGNVIEGVESYLSFTMVLTEHRQVNTKRSLVNLVNYDASESFKTRLRDRGLLAR